MICGLRFALWPRFFKATSLRVFPKAEFFLCIFYSVSQRIIRFGLREHTLVTQSSKAFSNHENFLASNLRE